MNRIECRSTALRELVAGFGDRQDAAPEWVTKGHHPTELRPAAVSR